MTPATTGTPEAVLVIEHAETVDLDGQPWPPPGDAWQVVRRAGGCRRWRRINMTPCADGRAGCAHRQLGGK
jgi:hypothetical protein